MHRNREQWRWCSNCGGDGHHCRECVRPITSYGIICYRWLELEKRYEIILIQRKYTIGYVEFMRGKYVIEDDGYILKLMDMMTIREKETIRNEVDYNKLRAGMFFDNNSNSFKREYADGMAKFNKLLVSTQLDRLIKQSLAASTNWPDQEWGLPKGRRNNKEKDLNCAIREFGEETGVTNIKVYANMIPLEENYIGVNGKKYRHIYYLAEYMGANDQLQINSNKPEQFNEISGLQWMSEAQCNTIIRPYYASKLAAINKAFQILKCLHMYFE
jgi:8-oxo-dGTP pyrophosphatase MutT (NUDIX family)